MSFLHALWGGLVLCLLGTSPVLLFAQDASAPDTVQVLDLSALLADIPANPSLRTARLGAEALGTRSRQVTALPDPSFMVSVQPFPMLTGHGFQRSMWSVEQMIPYPGTRALRGEIANLDAEMADLEADIMAQELAFQVKQAYFELLRVQEQDRLIASFQRQLRDFEEAAATRYEVGMGTQQAMLKAQLERNRLAIHREQLGSEHRAALETLARLLDRPDLNGLQGTVRFVAQPTPLDTTHLLSIALLHRPEAEMLHHAVLQAEVQMRLAKKAFKPDFTVNATYFDMRPADAPPTADGTDAFGVGVGVKVPLWRDKLRASLEEAEVRQRQVSTREETLELTFRTQIADLVNRLARQQQQLDLYRTTLLPQAETTLEATLSAYNTGRVTFLDLLDADRTLFSLRLDEIDTYTRYLQTRATLERTLGVNSLDDLD